MLIKGNKPIERKEGEGFEITETVAGEHQTNPLFGPETVNNLQNRIKKISLIKNYMFKHRLISYYACLIEIGGGAVGVNGTNPLF